MDPAHHALPVDRHPIRSSPRGTLAIKVEHLALLIYHRFGEEAGAVLLDRLAGCGRHLSQSLDSFKIQACSLLLDTLAGEDTIEGIEDSLGLASLLGVAAVWIDLRQEPGQI